MLVGLKDPMLLVLDRGFLISESLWSLFGVCGGCLMPGSRVVYETALLIVPLVDLGYPTIVALSPGRLQCMDGREMDLCCCYTCAFA
ncbi:hypothetical protein Nepgr_021088 [Nepenthes gracilis]|uniref:Uncharacterized protein n=1 Tax=Nepenthes gracilis TaxID=150966 RepID=A0AAD3SZ59_NEPGR|nr:hypothetical protein Nepgr_021088 [Nepenthes gracilis]